jgi:hypothetical protein
MRAKIYPLNIFVYFSTFLLKNIDMAKLEQSTNDDMTAPEIAVTDTGIPAELPSDTQAIEPLEVEEAQPVRTKLRIYATLLALYVFDLSLNF